MVSDPFSLRLFVSADIAGSTQLKSSKVPGRVASWRNTILGFFRRFPDIVVEHFEVPEATTHGGSHEPLSPWKYSGDEILLSARLTDCRQVDTHLKSFTHAASDYVRGPDGQVGLRLTAWLAGFPVTNAEFTTPDDGGPRATEYVGPQMDLGFRLAEHADASHLTMSADLAYMLAKVEGDLGDRLRHSGRVYIRGVQGGMSYPLVVCPWHDPELAKAESVALGAVCDREALAEFLKLYLDGTPGMRVPFIDGDEHPEFGDVPSEMRDLREQLEQGIEPERQRDHGPEEAGGASDVNVPEPRLTADAPLRRKP